MRGRGLWAWALVLSGALGLTGCATLTPTEAIARRETSRRREVQHTDGALRVAVQQDGFVARIRTEREDRCHTVDRIVGEETVTTTRAVADLSSYQANGQWGGVALALGAAFTLGGVYSSFSDADDPESARTASLALGVTGMVIGLGLVASWIHAETIGGTSESVRPYARTEVIHDHPDGCPLRPGRAVLVFHNGSRRLMERSSDAQGVLALNLAEALPVEAFRGPAPWGTLTVSSPNTAMQRTVDLAPYRVAVADVQWEQARSRPSAEAFARFASDFPQDERATEAQTRVRSMERARAALALDAERGVRWQALGDDEAGLAAFVAEGAGDVYEAAAACRRAARAMDTVALGERLGGCEATLGALPVEVREQRAEVVGAAEADRRQARARLTVFEAAAREAAERAEAARAEAERDAQSRRDRSRRTLARAAQGALSQARAAAGACRAGRGTGAAAARGAYQALAGAREGISPGALRAAVVGVAAACRCTPGCAGVSLP